MANAAREAAIATGNKSYYTTARCMTRSKTLLSVRLDPALAESLDEYCAATGRTRSTVVQEGVTEYLISRSGPTLHSLAEAILPPIAEAESKRTPKPASRQQRFRDYVRAKHRR